MTLKTMIMVLNVSTFFLFLMMGNVKIDDIQPEIEYL